MPLVMLFVILLDVIAFAYPLVVWFLWREWYKYNDTAFDDYADRCLYFAIALLALILLGRFLMKLLLSKSRKGEDEPYMMEPAKRESIQRPDGNTINIEYFGKEDAQPIIYVHGLNANIKNWYYQVKHFSKDYRVIAMDLPGLGRSTRPKNKNFSLLKIATDLQAVIDHTGAKNPVLWGHSMGGMTILTLMTKLKTPGDTSIRGLILQHTTYTNPVKTMMLSPVMTAIQKPVLVPLCYIIMFLSPVLWISRWMSYFNGNAHVMTRFMTFAGTQTQKQLDFTTLLSTLAPPAIMARSVLAMFKYDVTKQLPQIGVPTLVIAADKDRLTKAEASQYIKNHIPDAQIVRVSPGNHQALIERHDEVNNAAGNFLSGLT